MWLDPLIQRQWLPNIQQMSENFNVRTLLLEQEYAVGNPEVFMCMSIALTLSVDSQKLTLHGGTLPNLE